MNDPNETICNLERDLDRMMEERDEAIRRADWAEEDAARNMKAALAWDAQAIGKALDMKVGTDVPGAVVPAIEAIKASLASAEAEVARLKALLEPKRPYEPKVGDVVGYFEDCVDDRNSRIVKALDGEYARIAYAYGGEASLMVKHMTFLRPATPAERAAAGLPAEAPAKPEVLPEHLAFLEASAYYWGTYGRGEEKWERMAKAGKALAAAVARRDGGAK